MTMQRFSQSTTECVNIVFVDFLGGIFVTSSFGFFPAYVKKIILKWQHAFIIFLPYSSPYATPCLAELKTFMPISGTLTAGAAPRQPTNNLSFKIMTFAYNNIFPQPSQPITHLLFVKFTQILFLQLFQGIGCSLLVMVTAWAKLTVIACFFLFSFFSIMVETTKWRDI